MTHITVIISHAILRFYLIDFQLNIDSSPNFAFLVQNQLKVLKYRFLKRMLLKRAKPRRLFFAKL